MKIRNDLLRRINRKQQEIEGLRLQIRERKAYIQGLQDTLKMLPRDFSSSGGPVLRPGTDLAKARDVIRKTKRPVHINILLNALGKTINKLTKAGLSGNIAAYVRRGEIFTRPAPNTFGLVEFDHRQSATPGAEGLPEDDLPENFGQEGEDDL